MKIDNYYELNIDKLNSENNINLNIVFYFAYLLVHSLATLLYSSIFSLYKLAISGVNGSSGFGSVKSEQIDNKIFETVKAGDQDDLRMSKQIPPDELTFGWNTFVLKYTFGGLKG
jgi:hypothetical protein